MIKQIFIFQEKERNNFMGCFEDEQKFEIMKKALLLILLVGILDIGVTKAADPNRGTNPDKANTNKLTHNKVLKKLGHGISHGYYAATHNKLTKALTINDGNQKYKNRDDI